MTRSQKIERMLSDWFERNTEFNVGEGWARYERDLASEGTFVSVDVPLFTLAEEIDREFDRLAGAPK